MHRKVARMVAVGLGLALTLGVASCGGEEPVTRAAFVREADATCRSARRDMRLTGNAQRDPRAFAARLIEARRALIADLDAIEAPEDLAGRYDSYLAALRESTDLSEQVVEQSGSDADGTPVLDGEAAATARERDRASREAFNLARGLGFRTCTA